MVNMKQLHTFSYGLLPFVLFTVILYAFFYNHHLLFAEQLRLFEWNKDYFNEIVYNPGGLSAHIGEFFTQFYHLNHFGGWILGAGVGLTGILYRNLICHWKIGGNVSWELIPITSLVFFYLNPNASLGLIFGLQITLLLARITLHEKEGKRKRLLILINLPICYFFTGIGCYLYLILIFLDEVFSKKKHSLLAWILYTLVTILLPILTYYKFDINETQAWIGIACFITQDLLHPLGIVIASFLISPLLAYGTYHLLQRLTDKKRFALNLLMAFFAIGIILSQLKNEDERLYQLHYLITHEKWDEAITFMQKKPVQNVLMSSYTNIALLHQQRLSKELFSYFQVAHVNEFWSSNHLLNYLTAETYFQLDMLYAARAYMFMANTQTPSGRSPLYLTRLAEIEYRRGKRAASLKYVALLESTLFYKDWAYKFRQKMNTDSSTKKSQLLPKTNKLFLAKEMLFNVEQFETQAGANNQKVIDFLLAKYMLNNQYNAFIQLAARTHLTIHSSKHYQEFLLMYAYLLKDNSLISKWQIEQTVIERFYRYLQINQSGKSPEEIQELLCPYKDTYWYYVQYNKKQI